MKEEIMNKRPVKPRNPEIYILGIGEELVRAGIKDAFPKI